MLLRHPMMILALLAVIACPTHSPAFAQSRECLKLQLRLADLPPPGNTLRRRYDAAIGDQRQELDGARRNAEHIGCSEAKQFAEPRCRAAFENIREMETNLVDLQNKRSYLTAMRDGDQDADNTRAALLAALRQNGCAADRYAARMEELDRNPDRTLKRGTEDDAPDDADAEQPDTVSSADPNSDEPGTFTIPNDENVISIPSGEDDSRRYRTVCVRTCDGYYFPMSPQSSRDDFARDQQNCESMCPGTDINTYYQDAGDSDTSRLMSTSSDEAYNALPTAYLYRRTDTPRPAGCGCGSTATTQQNFEVIGGGDASSAAQTQSDTLPTPLSRPDGAADPETTDNRDGGLTDAAIRRLASAKATVLPPSGERKVRVVGPAFLPDRSKEEGRPDPDRRSAQ